MELSFTFGLFTQVRDSGSPFAGLLVWYAFWHFKGCHNIFSIYFLLDVLELHGRLFDHRPVLQGHITSFVKEFEVRYLTEN